jgi:hypothetical protein
MAHYALLNENNLVINVITGIDEDIIQTDLDGTIIGGSSEAWEDFYASRPWLNATSCKRTSYNSKIRGTYAGIEYTYNANEDIFITPQPYLSWTRSGSFWYPPTTKPEGLNWVWNEDTLSWIAIES